MRVITRKRISEAKEQYPSKANALDAWYKIIIENQFKNYAELKNCFNSVDKVGNYYVFNIGGNKLRLVANIHFNRKKIYIKKILTHTEYDKTNWIH